MRLRERWEDLPIRLRAGLSALFLVLALLLLWWLSGWAWPTRALAHRALEREHLFGRGEIVAEGEITRFEDAPHSSQQGTHFVVSERDGRYIVSLLRPKWGFLWRIAEDLFWPYQVLIPTEEDPLAYGFLAGDPLYTADGSGLLHAYGWGELLLVVSADPDIVRVEVTMDLVSQDELEQDPDWGLHHGVTVEATETGPGSGLWLAPIILEKSGGTVYVVLRGYDAAGELVYTYIPQ